MLLEVKDITVQYNKNPNPTIQGFSLQMGEGEVVSVVGESGSGKTTVIRAILGLLPGGGRITEGDIVFEGKSLQGFSPKEWRRLRGSRISMIFQDSGAMIIPIKKIGTQYVDYILTHEKLSKKDAWDRACEMLTRMRLPDAKNVMNSYPFQLSGGMRQRCGIAMAMTFQPKLLLADEPTSALDVTTQAQIVRQRMELREEYGTSIIMVTHNIGVAAYMGDSIIVMQNGKVVDRGDRDAILKQSKVEYTRSLMAAVPTLEGFRYN